jgi:glucosamine--fructose-6-phosphate aminotransferase (isomerizing)
MCGIVGYLGKKEVSKVLLDGLKALEYRGYDSAGIAVSSDGPITRLRAPGKLTNLEEKVKSSPVQGSVGIGHTRWATHGRATEENAHPHNSEDIYLVHNGIIENYYELKEELQKEGHSFTSETDSELIAHLFTKFLKNEEDLLKVTLKVRSLLKGAYAVLAIDQKRPNMMVGFKHGPPLLMAKGKAEGEILFASDALAVVEHSSEVHYLSDGEIAIVDNGKVMLFDESSNALEPKWNELKWSASQISKHGFEHFMLKEIYEQPVAYKNAISPHIKDQKEVEIDRASGLSQEYFKDLKRIFIVACGTSFYAALYAKYVIEKLSGLPVEVDIASEFRYRNPSLPEGSLVMVLSQSGETADTLAALRLANEKGLKTLSLCNTKASTIDREADFNLYMNSGPEIGVASTKAFTSSLGVLALLALFAAKARGQLTVQKEEEYVSSLLALPSKMEAALAYDNYFKEASRSFKDFKGFLYMGRGLHYPIALEGALKMKELAYKHAEGYAAGEMKHGPLALIDENMLIFMLCPRDELFEKTLSNLEEAKARGGYIVTVGTLEDEKLKGVSDQYLSLPKADELTTPMLEVLPVQLLAYHVSRSLGHDVDQPRNLAKSVTVE